MRAGELLLDNEHECEAEDEGERDRGGWYFERLGRVDESCHSSVPARDERLNEGIGEGEMYTARTLGQLRPTLHRVTNRFQRTTVQLMRTLQSARREWVITERKVCSLENATDKGSIPAPNDATPSNAAIINAEKNPAILYAGCWIVAGLDFELEC